MTYNEDSERAYKRLISVSLQFSFDSSLVAVLLVGRFLETSQLGERKELVQKGLNGHGPYNIMHHLVSHLCARRDPKFLMSSVG